MAATATAVATATAALSIVQFNRNHPLLWNGFSVHDERKLLWLQDEEVVLNDTLLTLTSTAQFFKQVAEFNFSLYFIRHYYTRGITIFLEEITPTARTRRVKHKFRWVEYIVDEGKLFIICIGKLIIRCRILKFEPPSSNANHDIINWCVIHDIHNFF